MNTIKMIFYIIFDIKQIHILKVSIKMDPEIAKVVSAIDTLKRLLDIYASKIIETPVECDEHLKYIEAITESLKDDMEEIEFLS